ncbi:FixH family protein [Paenibacillus methanolicus]|uniref:YtkA-like protein n=1 Tax=Paenibacillus methanolicus TaxID=582686 RepID=A0A5S5CK19_9BACL|nr:FixH family protein [Paenibacillus methanolicus]TYP79353.1 YtkA-like protein [Paenibacillus methanolicus]
MSKRRLFRSASLGSFLLLSALLFGCTANIPETGESGLPAHLTVDLHLPKTLEVGEDADFSVEVSKGGKPVRHTEQAQFLFWPEGKSNAAVTMKATESLPGVYTVSHRIDGEGIYYVQSLIQTGGERVLPIKRFAVGPKAVEELIAMESAARSDETAHGEHH